MPRTRSAPATADLPPSDPSPQFQQETVRLLTTLRDLLAALVRALPARPATASELQRATRLDMKLCWKVFRVIQASNGLSGALYVPGPANMRDLLRTMSRLGAPDSLIDRTAAAARDFDRLVAEHAGDRRTFDCMVSSSAGIERDKADLRQRRAGFQAASHTWGVQADAMTMTMIQRPAAHDPRRLDEIGLRAEYGVRRLRPTTMPLYEQVYATLDKQGKEYSAGRRRPLSDGAPPSPHGGNGIGGVSLVPEFCSRPLPDVVVRDGIGGRSTATLMHTELGIKAAVDLVMGFTLQDGAPRYKGEETHGWCIAHVAKPVRVVIIDLILEAGTLPHDPRPIGFMTTKNSQMCPPEELWTTGLLSDAEPVTRLGRGPEVLAAAEIPRYPDLVAWSIRKSGWDPDRFEAWRLRVDYPVALTSVGLVYEMPAEPIARK